MNGREGGSGLWGGVVSKKHTQCRRGPRLLVPDQREHDLLLSARAHVLEEALRGGG